MGSSTMGDTTLSLCGLSEDFNEIGIISRSLKKDCSFQAAFKLRRAAAIDMFEKIIESNQILMDLDYDVTFSSNVEDPHRPSISDPDRRRLSEFARYFLTAIVRARCRDKVYKFVRFALE